MTKAPSVPVDPYISRVLAAVKRGPGRSAVQIASDIGSARERVRECLAEHAQSAATGHNGTKAWYLKGTAPTSKVLGESAQKVIADPVERMQKRDEFAETKREHKELTQRLFAAEERERVRDALKRYELKPIKPREFKSGKRNMTAVVLASDWHVEENVSLIKTAGYNESNLAMSDVKQGRFFSGIRWLLDHERADKSFSIRDLVLWLGGDFMTGSIHEDPKRDLSPLETMRWLKQRISSGIKQLLLDPQLETITIPCSFGNHDRTTKYANFSTGAENSYAWLLYQDLADVFEGEKRVQFLADRAEFQYATVYDKTLMFHHGHRINYGGGVGGIVIPVRKAMAQWVKVRHFDFAHHGHFHTLYDFENVTGNGSLIGYNEFAMGIKATPEPPAQAFYLLDSKRGKCCKTPIWAGE